MADHLRERYSGDEEGEGKTTGTRSRRASCGEELSSSGLASPRQTDVSQGAADRRLSLPATLPVTPDSSAVTPLENRPQLTEVPPPAMVPAACPASWSHATPPACPHRLHVSVGGPPCYPCSVLDVPPKYRKREARVWQRVKEKLVRFSLGSLTLREVGTPRGQGPTASIYTIGEWPLRNVPGAASTQEASVSPSAVPGCWAPQERDNSGFDIQETGEGGTLQEDNSRTVSQLPSPAAHSATQPVPPLLYPSCPEFRMSPPPYSPTPTATTHLPPHFQPQNSLDASRSIRCSKHLVCQLLYSFVLAMATSTLIVSFDQPVIIIASVVVFMTMFVFLPVITLIECLFRIRVERSFRQHIVGLISSPPQPQSPCINPIIV